MLHNLFSIRQFQLTKWSFLVHSYTHNAPYIHLSHDSILELWQTFLNGKRAWESKNIMYRGTLAIFTVC